MTLKRLWDTDNKKIVFAEWPTGHQCQVWTDENGNLYIYDMAQWLVYSGVNPWKEYVRSNWVALTDEMVWYYDTNEPTDLYNRDHWDEAYYQFVNYDGTVLQSWTVEEWETPSYTGETPTKPATSEYTYTFSGWNPEVWPIYRRTTYTATFTAVANTYTVTIESNNTDYGTVSPSTVTEVPYWTAISSSSNTLTIWETTVTATAETGYEFSSWGELPATVTDDITITATFQATLVPIVNEAFLAEDGSEDNPLMVLFTDGSDQENFVEISLTTDPETWDSSVEITPEWIYADSRLEIDWTNVFVSLFENYSDSTYYEALAWSWTTDDTWTIIAGFFTALQNLYENPTAENLAAAGAILSWYSVADPQTMFVTWTTPTPPTPWQWYRYIRWNITAQQWPASWGAENDCQVSEFLFTNWTSQMSRPAWTSVTCNRSTWGDWAASNLIDWSTATKFGAWDAFPYAITFDLWSGNSIDPTVYNKYQWYQATAPSSEWYRSPKSWNVQFSEDWTDWETWSTVTDEVISFVSGGLAWTWDLTSPSPR